jgi:hypothetical protein
LPTTFLGLVFVRSDFVFSYIHISAIMTLDKKESYLNKLAGLI